jgi:hypothetical protein
LRKLVALRTLTRDSNPEQSQIHDIDIKKLQTWRKKNPELSKNIKMKGGIYILDDKYEEIKRELKENTTYLFSVLWGGGRFSMSFPFPLYITFFAKVTINFNSIVFLFKNIKGENKTPQNAFPYIYPRIYGPNVISYECGTDYHCDSLRKLARRFNGSLFPTVSTNYQDSMTLYRPSRYMSSYYGRGSKIFWENLKFKELKDIINSNINMNTKSLVPIMQNAIKNLWGDDFILEYSHEKVFKLKEEYDNAFHKKYFS